MKLWNFPLLFKIILCRKSCWVSVDCWLFFQKKISKLESFFLICDCNFWVFFKFNWVLPHEWVSRSARRKVWKLMDCSEVLTPRVSKSKCMDWFFLPGQFFFQTSIFYQNAENISSFFWSLAQFIWCSISKNIDVILENS